MKTALAFSGGKDSWACLWLHRDRLADITVIWVNTGKNYPELLATIEKARALCPNFVELIVDRDGQNSHHGIPADVVPINWTRQGQQFTGAKPVTIQPYLLCCYENIVMHLQGYCKAQGVTHLIRGQRNDEGHRSSARDGDVVDGIVYLQPIENWTGDEVLEFVGRHMALPDHFQFAHSSMDCYDCTAYATESKDRIAHMKDHHPILFAEYDKRKTALNNALRQALEE
jgi:3'-phosphoadenosine 5'-phosphosulfate sulfotransferase (PAPS reductase)/FAD synthetase